MLSFSTLFRSLSTQQKLFLEEGGHSIWQQHFSNGGVHITLFAFFEMRQLAASNQVETALFTFSEKYPSLSESDDEEELFLLPYQTIPTMDKNELKRLKQRLAIYKNFAKGTVTARHLIPVRETFIVKMELFAARAAAYTISRTRPDLWQQDSIKDFYKSFGAAMIYSTALFAHKLKDKINYEDAEEFVPQWLAAKLKEFFPPKPKTEKIKQRPVDPPLESLRKGFWVTEHNLSVKRLKLDTTNEGKFVEIVLLIN